MREDQPGHAHPHDSRVEGGDGWRRHRVDEVRSRRQAIRDQSRVWVLWRGAGYQHEVECECHADGDAKLHFYELCHDPGRRRLVGRDERTEATGVNGLAAAAVEAGFWAPGGTS